MTDSTQTISCAGDLTVTSTSASCSVGFESVTGFIPTAQVGDLIAVIAVLYFLKKAFDLVLSLMGFRS
jgi:hypothetical protein